MDIRLSRREGFLLAACAVLMLAAVLAPAVPGHLHSHGFADPRPWLGIPCAMDVLSNLGFALMGVWGLACLARGAVRGADGVPRAAWPRDAVACAALFFGGLVLTSAGSAWYHWQPDDAGLVWDRAAMAVAFAGMLGLAAGSRISGRAALVLAGFSLAAGLVAVVVWHTGGNLLPWIVLQFGGMALVLGLACLRAQPGALSLPLAVVIVIYALAKLLELADHEVFAATAGWVSGHSLKHLVASFAAVPVLYALAMWPVPVVRHNARSPEACSGDVRKLA